MVDCLGLPGRPTCIYSVNKKKQETYKSASTEFAAVHKCTTGVYMSCVPALTGTMLQLYAFISEVTGAVVSKLKKNI